MVKLSEIQKPINVAQFAKKKIYVKRFCANGTFVKDTKFDNGQDFNFYPEEPVLFDGFDEEISTEELSEFSGLMDEMVKYGNTFSRLFSITPERFTAYKQFAIKIKEYIKDKTMPSRRTFQYRMKQVIGYINATSAKILANTLPYAIQYLKEYIEQYITMSVNKGAVTNIAMALGMYRYLPDRSSARVLQRVLRKIMTELNSTETITKISQKRMQMAYKSMFANLLEGIMTKVRDPVKRGMLDEMINGINENIDKSQANEEPEEEGVA